MPVWHDNMTSEDFDRNHREWRDQKRSDLAAARSMVRQWQAEVARLEDLVKMADTTEPPRSE